MSRGTGCASLAPFYTTNAKRLTLLLQSMLNCIDNSGAAVVECVNVLKMKRAAKVGTQAIPIVTRSPLHPQLLTTYILQEIASSSSSRNNATLAPNQAQMLQSPYRRQTRFAAATSGTQSSCGPQRNTSALTGVSSNSTTMHAY